MDRFPQVLTLSRVLLRPVAREDLGEIARQLGDDRVYPWLAAVPHPFRAEDAEALFLHSRDPSERVRIVEREGQIAGCLCLGAAMWYWLDPAHWGHGVLSEALEGALAAYFNGLAPPLVATCREDNAASLALLGRLGFSRFPTGRRMFFHGTQSAHPCRDHAMTREQWHFLHPPALTSGGVTLHPAGQKDAAFLARILPRAEATGSKVWPDSNGLSRFIETHRHRGGATGLFLIRDSDRRAIGMALRAAEDVSPELLFLSPEDAVRHGEEVAAALGQNDGQRR